MNVAVKPSELFPDPKAEILKKLGDISQAEIAQNEVLLAMYMRPEKTAGGIIMPHQNLKEDRFQGKVGLVVKIGKACRFTRVGTDGVIYGIDIQLHDWVAVRTSDTWALEINADPNVSDPRAFTLCRLVFDDQIRMKVPHPGMVW
jgi:co-chaperonin GroES (HSP10)